jgi:transcriptional regulator with XRE-family HTH domain
MNETLDRIPSNPTADKIDAAFPGGLHPIETMTSFRARMNLSRRELATLAGVTQSQVWRMEKFTSGNVPTMDITLWVTIWDALLGFEGANPAGKPKSTSKTKKNDTSAHLNDLRALAADASLAIAVMKEKKQSSVPMQTLLTRIDKMIAELSK